MSVPDSPDPAHPAPARIAYSAAADVAWYATLPTMFGAAAAIFTDRGGRVLLVKPNYRDHWSLPGGIIDEAEPPHECCRREVEEEIGLQMTPGPLLVIDWAPPDGIRPRPLVHFVFDGGELDDGVPIRLQESELDDYRFVEADQVARYLPPFLAARVAAALRSRVAGGTVYLPLAQPTAEPPDAAGGSVVLREARAFGANSAAPSAIKRSGLSGYHPLPVVIMPGGLWRTRVWRNALGVKLQ